MLHIIPFAALGTTAAVVAAWPCHDWQAHTMRRFAEAIGATR